MITIKINQYGNEATITAEGNWKGISQEVKKQIRKKENTFYSLSQAEKIKQEFDNLLNDQAESNQMILRQMMEF